MRIAEIADAEEITKLINAAFVVERPFIDGDRIDLEQVLARFAKGEFLVMHEDGAMIGCVYIEPRGERSYLGLLSIDPSRQRSRPPLGSQDGAGRLGARARF